MGTRVSIDLPTEQVAGRITFVGGLHRSGTTPLTRWLARHPAISGLENTGVQEDEGQHLQSVYPAAHVHGGPGRFAFDRGAWLTESSALVGTESSDRLVRSWAPYWDLSCEVLLEKSPPNLVRMRFLRALFPEARFIMVVRHPVAVAMATQKWSKTSLRSLIEHWVRAHERLVEDARAVGRVAVVRYEDLMRAPNETLGGLFQFLGVEPYAETWNVTAQLNSRYFAQYDEVTRSIAGRVTRMACQRFESFVAPFGYSLRDPRALSQPVPALQALGGLSAPASPHQPRVTGGAAD